MTNENDTAQMPAATPLERFRKCSDCKHCSIAFSNWLFGVGADMARCAHPVLSNRPSETAERWHLGLPPKPIVRREYLPFAAHLRRPSSPHRETRCTPEALYFEPKGRRIWWWPFKRRAS